MAATASPPTSDTIQRFHSEAEKMVEIVTAAGGEMKSRPAVAQTASACDIPAAEIPWVLTYALGTGMLLRDSRKGTVRLPGIREDRQAR